MKCAEWALEARGQGLRSEGSPCCWVCYVFCLSVTQWEGVQALFPGPKAMSLNGRAKIVSVWLLCGAHVFGGEEGKCGRTLPEALVHVRLCFLAY